MGDQPETKEQTKAPQAPGRLNVSELQRANKDMLAGLAKATEGLQNAGIVPSLIVTKDGKALTSPSESAKLPTSKPANGSESGQPKRSGGFSLGSLVKSVTDRAATNESPSKPASSADTRSASEKPKQEKKGFLDGLFSKKPTEDAKPPVPNPAREGYFQSRFAEARQKVHEKYASATERRSNDPASMKARTPIDRASQALDHALGAATRASNQATELAALEDRPPQVVDINKDAGFLLKQALGDSVKEIAIGGPNNDDVRIELTRATSTTLLPYKEGANPDPKNPEAVKMDFAPVLTFKLQRNQGSIVLKAPESGETGITVGKPNASYVNPEYWSTANLDQLVIGKNDQGKYVATADVSVGPISLQKNVPIQPLQYATLDAGVKMVLNKGKIGSVDTRVAELNPSPRSATRLD